MDDKPLTTNIPTPIIIRKSFLIKKKGTYPNIKHLQYKAYTKGRKVSHGKEIPVKKHNY
jgi:hypothetical protein